MPVVMEFMKIIFEQVENKGKKIELNDYHLEKEKKL